MGKIMIEIPEGLPLEDLKKKIDILIIEEEAKQTLCRNHKEKNDLCEGELKELEEPKLKIGTEDRKMILDKYYGTIKLDRPISLEEILDQEEDA